MQIIFGFINDVFRHKLFQIPIFITSERLWRKTIFDKTGRQRIEIVTKYWNSDFFIIVMRIVVWFVLNKIVKKYGKLQYAYDFVGFTNYRYVIIGFNDHKST